MSSSLSKDGPLFLAYFSLISLALVSIYFGSYASLRTPRSVLKARKALKKGTKATGGEGDEDEGEDGEEEDDDDDEPAAEVLTSSDAWMFPVIGSCVLFSLYLVFKFLDRYWVDKILGVYFGFIGIGSVFKTFLSIVAGIVGVKKWREWHNYKLKVTKRMSDAELEAEKKERKKAEAEAKKKGDGDEKEEEDAEPQGRVRTALQLRLSLAQLPIFLVSLVPIVVFHMTRHWLASNIIALCLALNAISLMGLDSFLTGSIMLGGLFFYDIFWVFGTEVMVSVARNFEAGPIKILFPKNLPHVASYYLSHAHKGGSIMQRLTEMFQQAPKFQMMMLGLGDIVIPGIFIALALRFDQHLHLSKLSKDQLANFKRRDTSFPKPYFEATLAGYIAGLTMTMGVMHVFKAAQPALLYLSPACVAAVALKSLQRGEWSLLWSWSDDDSEEAEKEKKRKEEGKTKGNGKAKKE